MAQSIKCSTLDFGSGHDLMVREFKPLTGLCAGGTEPAWDSLSPSVVPLLAQVCFLSLKNKQTLKKKEARICLHNLHKLW